MPYRENFSSSAAVLAPARRTLIDDMRGFTTVVETRGIRADVSWESLAVRHADAVAEANGDGTSNDIEPLRNSKKTGKFKKVCLTDPDASMATSGRNRRLEPSYKQHGVIDYYAVSCSMSK